MTEGSCWHGHGGAQETAERLLDLPLGESRGHPEAAWHKEYRRCGQGRRREVEEDDGAGEGTLREESEGCEGGVRKRAGEVQGGRRGRRETEAGEGRREERKGGGQAQEAREGSECAEKATDSLLVVAE